MQDDQISQKFIGLTPADMDRLNKYRKKFSVVNSLVCQLGYTYLIRAYLVYKGNHPFLLMHSPSSLDYSDFYEHDTFDRSNLNIYSWKIIIALRHVTSMRVINYNPCGLLPLIKLYGIGILSPSFWCPSSILELVRLFVDNIGKKNFRRSF
jgi:hypothetical protein